MGRTQKTPEPCISFASADVDLLDFVKLDFIKTCCAYPLVPVRACVCLPGPRAVGRPAMSAAAGKSLAATDGQCGPAIWITCALSTLAAVLLLLMGLAAVNKGCLRASPPSWTQYHASGGDVPVRRIAGAGQLRELCNGLQTSTGLHDRKPTVTILVLMKQY